LISKLIGGLILFLGIAGWWYVVSKMPKDKE
jgi:hypothetical protein